MKKALLIAVCVLFIAAGAAHADSLSVGGNFPYIYGIEYAGTADQTSVYVGGGSIDTSILNGTALKYTYCVGLFTTVNAGDTYGQTSVNNAGQINGSAVNNAAEIAYLLAVHGTAGQGETAQALQAAIWTVEYGATGATGFQLDVSKYGAGTQIVTDYTNYLSEAALHTGNISDFYWMTPGKEDGSTYQGLVAPTPIPSAVLLILPGFLGLFGMKKRLKML